MKFSIQPLIYKLMNNYIVANIAIMLLSPWWWITIKRDFLIGLLVFVLSIIIFPFFFYSKYKILFLSILVLTGMMIINVRQGFDENILRISSLEIQRFYRRDKFFGPDLGKLYKNRTSISYFKNYYDPLSKLQSNFSGNLDLNLYFFTNHPRERGGIEEFEKYLPIFLPFFIVGFLYSVYNFKYKQVLYIVTILIISALISPYYKLGPILIFPIINSIMSMGFIFSLKFASKIFKNDF